MRQARSGLYCLLLAFLSLAGFVYLAPASAASLGLDVWNLPALMTRIDRDTTTGRQLEACDRLTFQRVLAKNEVTREVVEGRLSLAEAVARFRELDATAPETYLHAWRAGTPGACDEERYHCTLLRHLEAYRYNQPEARPPAMGQPARTQ
jgi:hypothetical protein